ncbi:cucumisin-like [Momordica charantia]|uniref:Cucumisin-like n=1 Tax=Momordica charantia TaxID=3673 RepID=A0A6J1CC81_MOMCH|nr:cucumisin-like [Momordica charantia]
MAFAYTLLVTSQASDDRKVYVVYMGKPSEVEGGFSAASARHANMLQQVLTTSDASNSLVYSYHRSFSGFAARLNDDEARKLAEMEGVVSVFVSEKKELHTTRSWDFMGLLDEASRTRLESDVIVGMLDTGIWPESKSFTDEGFGPPPPKWKGKCQSSSNFTCNNKLIGARFYRSNPVEGGGDILSPRDTEGHGTHTSSTAAGNLVAQASLFGLGLGTSRGGVPSARVAVYKICWSDGCSDADILAAFDDAIADGVDVISISVGGSIPREYFKDSIAIGAFHAMKNGILTSNSAGNTGPGSATISNVSPWSLSVAASTIDRKFVTKVKLGNGKAFEGISVNTFQLEDKMFPLIYAGDAPNSTAGFNGSLSRFCFPGSLDMNLVQGKIVFCDEIGDGTTALSSGAIGTIMQDANFLDVAFVFPLPASKLDLNAGSKVFQYLRSTSNPEANIEKSTTIDDLSAPFVVSFSSRGPNQITLDILKPDLTAPGVDILASWSEDATVTSLAGDNRVVPFNIISGTSMSCPHATGTAAYVKSFHPTWSPAAIKSALMTTAFPMTPKLNADAEFAYGAGHLNPVNAINPGLVYDATEIDYIKFLCGQGFSTNNLSLVTGDQSNCSDVRKTAASDLNYPSFALSIKTRRLVSRVFHRTVTNVGLPVSTYKAIIQAAPGLKVTVRPATLSFSSLGQKISFTVRIKAKTAGKLISGSLTWDDGVHLVRSPIVTFVNPL